MPRNEGKYKISSFVFSLIFKSQTFFPHTSILTKNDFLVTLRAKYKNDPNNMKKCHMFQVIEISQARGISKYFLTGLKEHTVEGYFSYKEVYLSINSLQMYA